MSKLEWIIKLIIIVVGSVIAAYGITLALYAGFGGATLAVLWQGISKTFHVSIGMASMIVAIVMIVFAFFYDRSQIHIGTILYQIVYSFCVDLFANAHVYSTHIWVNALIMLLGIVLFAIGTGFYAAASLGRGSYEALTFSLAEKNNWQVKIVRMVLDVVMVVTGVMLGGKFGICTMVTILISGPVIQFTAAKTKKLICIACGNWKSTVIIRTVLRTGGVFVVFSENLKMLRRQKGISQEVLAQELNVVRQTVSKWEKGVSHS